MAKSPCHSGTKASTWDHVPLLNTESNWITWEQENVWAPKLWWGTHDFWEKLLSLRHCLVPPAALTRPHAPVPWCRGCCSAPVRSLGSHEDQSIPPCTRRCPWEMAVWPSLGQPDAHGDIINMSLSNWSIQLMSLVYMNFLIKLLAKIF